MLGAKTGAALWAYAHGKDDRPVEPPKARKSVGAEVNYGIRFTGVASVDSLQGVHVVLEGSQLVSNCCSRRSLFVHSIHKCVNCLAGRPPFVGYRISFHQRFTIACGLAVCEHPTTGPEDADKFLSELAGEVVSRMGAAGEQQTAGRHMQDSRLFSGVCEGLLCRVVFQARCQRLCPRAPASHEHQGQNPSR